MVRRSVVWPGIVMHGMVKLGEVWPSEAWCGEVRFFNEGVF